MRSVNNNSEGSGEESEEAAENAHEDGDIGRNNNDAAKGGDLGNFRSKDICFDNEAEDDGENSNMARIDILTSPLKSDEEAKVVSQPACVLRCSEF
ncbi:hypothetical protein SLA2020_263820 [Shorea laevis]